MQAVTPPAIMQGRWLMELGSLPLWAQQLGSILLTVGTAVAILWNEKRKPKKPAETEGGDTAQVVAASFIEKRLMERLIEILGAMNTNLVTMNRHMEKVNDRMQEDDIVQAAVARMKENRQ